MKRYDVVVLGADVEGLAAAAHLAARRRVLVLDRSPAPGGPHAGLAFHPGYTTAGVAAEAGAARRELLRPLGLEQAGLAWRESEPGLLLIGDGATLRWHREREPALSALARELPQEVPGLERWHAFHARVAPLLAEALDDPPPPLEVPRPAELLRLGARGLRLRRLGEGDLHTLLRAASLPAEDWTHQWFQSPLLCTAATAVGLGGSRLGPRAAGTGLLSLFAAAAGGPGPRGGTAALVQALAACCRSRGVDLALGDEPRRIVVEGGRVRGLRSASQEVRAEHVLSCLGPRRTAALLDPRATPPGLARAARAFRSRGATSVLSVALDHVPSFGDEREVERVVIARSLVHLERVADALKHGELPRSPWVELRVHAGPPCAPEGHALLAARVHGSCRALRGGWTDEAREALFERAWAALERALPGLRGRAVACHLETPDQLEERLGLDGGHLEGGELALDQLWVLRPSLALARYATDLAGLWLGGASQHPGGPFLGGAGSLAARALLAGKR